MILNIQTSIWAVSGQKIWFPALKLSHFQTPISQNRLNLNNFRNPARAIL